MKFGISIVFAALVASPAFAFDTPVCGTVTTSTTGPTCTSGTPCPMFEVLHYEIGNTTLNPDTPALLEQLGQAANDKESICAVGYNQNVSPPTFEVQSIEDDVPVHMEAANAPLQAPGQAFVTPKQETAWYSGQDVITIGQPTTISFPCGHISLPNWNENGTPMHGTDYSGLLESPTDKGTPARVVATTQKNGTLKVVVNSGGASNTYVFDHTRPTSPPLQCL